MTSIHDQITSAATLPVLEPLSKATETTFKPVALLDTDYLHVELDDEGKRFITQATALRPFRSAFDSEEDVVLVNGEKLVADSRGPSTNAAETWQKRIPERKGGVGSGLGFGRWILAGTDFTALVMHHVWPIERIVFKDDDAKLLYDFLLKRFLHQSKGARIAAEFKVNGIVPEMPEDWVDSPDPDLVLTDYQKVGMLTTLHQESKALFMEQGTGKTAVSIHRVCLEARRKRAGRIPGVKNTMYRVLVVCPRQVRLNWEVEFQRFATGPGKTVVLRGGPVGRVKNLVEGVRDEADCEWSACMVSMDSVGSTWDALKKVPWDLVIIDESHFIKGARTKRATAMHKFNQIRCRQRMALTGTPIPNSIFDLYSQLEFLGEGLSGFMSRTNFRAFHGKFKKQNVKGGSSIQKLVGIKGIPLIQERLARLAFMIRKEEAGLGLPDKVYAIEEVQMTPRQTEFYNKLASQMAIEIESMVEEAESGKRTLAVDHILTMLLRLAQITSGHVKWDGARDPVSGEETEEGKVEQIDEVNPKVESIVEFLTAEDRDPNGKTIVWCHFIEDIRVLSAALADAGIQHVGYHAMTHPEFKARTVEDAERIFNCTPECKVFIGNPASGGTGLNIIGYDREKPDEYETYTDTEIFLSTDWNAAKRSQAEDRAHRRGTRMPVRIVDLVVPGTIDEEIRARVAGKRKTALAIQDVRDILGRILDFAKAQD
jgi:hypothetical protein